MGIAGVEICWVIFKTGQLGGCVDIRDKLRSFPLGVVQEAQLAVLLF